MLSICKCSAQPSSVQRLMSFQHLQLKNQANKQVAAAKRNSIPPFSPPTPSFLFLLHRCTICTVKQFIS